MNKADWINLLENSFQRVDTRNNLVFEKSRSDKRISFPISTDSTVYELPLLNDEQRFSIVTQDIVETKQTDVEDYEGKYIIVKKDLEVCMLIDEYGVHYIPWDVIRVITVTFEAIDIAPDSHKNSK